MANNVYSTIQFQEGDNEAEREFIRIFEFIQTFDEKGLEFADFYLTNQEIVDDDLLHFHLLQVYKNILLLKKLRILP